MHHYVSVFLAISVLQVNMHTLITKKKTRNCESCITLRLMRRALDSGPILPYSYTPLYLLHTANNAPLQWDIVINYLLFTFLIVSYYPIGPTLVQLF